MKRKVIIMIAAFLIRGALCSCARAGEPPQKAQIQAGLDPSDIALINELDMLEHWEELQDTEVFDEQIKEAMNGGADDE